MVLEVARHATMADNHCGPGGSHQGPVVSVIELRHRALVTGGGANGLPESTLTAGRPASSVRPPGSCPMEEQAPVRGSMRCR